MFLHVDKAFLDASFHVLHSAVHIWISDLITTGGRCCDSLLRLLWDVVPLPVLVLIALLLIVSGTWNCFRLYWLQLVLIHAGLNFGCCNGLVLVNWGEHLNWDRLHNWWFFYWLLIISCLNWLLGHRFFLGWFSCLDDWRRSGSWNLWSLRFLFLWRLRFFRLGLFLGWWRFFLSRHFPPQQFLNFIVVLLAEYGCTLFSFEQEVIRGCSVVKSVSLDFIHDFLWVHHVVLL